MKERKKKYSQIIAKGEAKTKIMLKENVDYLTAPLKEEWLVYLSGYVTQEIAKENSWKIRIKEHIN